MRDTSATEEEEEEERNKKANLLRRYDDDSRVPSQKDTRIGNFLKQKTRSGLSLARARGHLSRRDANREADSGPFRSPTASPLSPAVSRNAERSVRSYTSKNPREDDGPGETRPSCILAATIFREHSVTFVLTSASRRDSRRSDPIKKEKKKRETGKERKLYISSNNMIKTPIMLSRDLISRLRKQIAAR